MWFSWSMNVDRIDHGVSLFRLHGPGVGLGEIKVSQREELGLHERAAAAGDKGLSGHVQFQSFIRMHEPLYFNWFRRFQFVHDENQRRPNQHHVANIMLPVC